MQSMLASDLTAGFGTLAFMVRQLQRNGELGMVTAALERAERSLARAYQCLEPTLPRAVLLTPELIASGRSWQAYLAEMTVDSGPALLARLQDVSAQARSTGEMIGTDSTVEDITIQVRSTLDQLVQIRTGIAVREDTSGASSP